MLVIVRQNNLSNAVYTGQTSKSMPHQLLSGKVIKILKKGKSLKTSIQLGDCKPSAVQELPGIFLGQSQ